MLGKLRNVTLLCVLLPFICHSAITGQLIVGDDEVKFAIKDVTSQSTPILELSSHSDFSRIMYSSDAGVLSSKTYVWTVKFSELTNGFCYWRVIAGDECYDEGNSFYVTKGNDPDEYTPVKDAVKYPKAKLENKSELTLESLWIRSQNIDNGLYKCHDKHLSMTSVHCFNHGFVVRDGVIYVSRGSLNVSSWDHDKSLLWLDRYDLATGEELPFLRIKLQGDADFTGDDVMPWIREDDDGTVYFTSAKYFTTASTAYALYTVDIDNLLGEDDEVAYASEQLKFSLNGNVKGAMFFSVKGSIKNRQYQMWMSPGITSLMTWDEMKFDIYRWSVDGRKVLEEKATISDAALVLNNKSSFMGALAKVYPVDNDYFYLHNNREQRNHDFFYPTLYRFTPNGQCTLVGSVSNNPKLALSDYSFSSGMSMLDVNGASLIAYGIPMSGASAVRIVETPSFTDNFSGHKSLWEINPVGFSSDMKQGCEVQFIPDGGESLDGHLVIYVANGGMAVYRLKVKPDPLGIDDVEAEEFSYRIDGTTLTFSRQLERADLYTLSGRKVRGASHASSLSIDGLSPDIYILTGRGISPVKIAIR